MSDIVYDGDHNNAFQHGPIVPWIDPEKRSRLYKVTMRQRASFFNPLKWSTRGPLSGGYLVEETQPHDTGVADIIEWERIYADVPRARVEVERGAYNLQGIQDGSLIELPLPKPFTMVFDYFHTTDPASIPLPVAFRAVQFGTTIFYLGTPPEEGVTTRLAEDTTPRRWKGNIWERRSAYVTINPLNILS